MADLQRIQFKRSTVAGKKPTTSQLAVGELAINLTDRTLYTSTGTAIVDLGFAKGGQVDGNITQTGNITSSGTIKGANLEGPLTGNAATATKLQTARTIGGVSFDGTANINLPGVNTAGNQNTSGNAASATKLQTARTINGVSFDGSANITIRAESPHNGTINSDATLSSATSQGLYTVSGYAINGLHNYGILRVYKEGTVIHQTYNAHNSSSLGSVCVRQSRDSGATWSAWRSLDPSNVSTATTLQTARTINGTSFNGSANITTANWGTARNLTIGNTAKSVNGSANVSWSLAEIGALPLTGGTLTGNLVLQNGTNEMQVKIGSEGTFLYGNATSMGMHINATKFIRLDAATGAVTNGVGVWTGDLSGNAATATKLQTARTIGGVSFDGSANINLPGVNTAGNQNTSGNAATATKLATARTIGGVSFDGTANINLPGVNTAGNQNTSGNAESATKLQTARTINGVSFNGTANITVPVDVVAIPANADLNTYQTAGFYTCASSSTAAALSNSPTAVAFSMLVEKHAGVRQTITEYTTSGYKIYIRNFYSNVWSSWERIYTTHDAPTSVTGNAGTATTLQTARTINGTSFNGSANITTANWGTARTLTVGRTGKSVNGSANISWTADEILPTGTNGQVLKHNGTSWVAGTDNNTTYSAMTASEATTGTATTARLITPAVLKSAINTHAPVQTTITGNAATATKLQTARTIGGVSFDGTANINLPGVNTPGNQNTSGNAASATKLETASGSAPSYAARTWVRFDGTDTVSITASGNVSSVTDIGLGHYTVNFTTAMPNANYAMVANAKRTNNTTNFTSNEGTYAVLSTPTTTKVNVATGTGSAYQDCALINVVILG